MQTPSKLCLRRRWRTSALGALQAKVSSSAPTVVGAAHEFEVDRKFQPTHNRYGHGRSSPFSYRSSEAPLVHLAPHTSFRNVACWPLPFYAHAVRCATIMYFLMSVATVCFRYHPITRLSTPRILHAGGWQYLAEPRTTFHRWLKRSGLRASTIFSKKRGYRR